MSERDNYEHGVPCFVSGVFPDPDAAASFYSELMGWETENLMPPEHPGDYFVSACATGTSQRSSPSTARRRRRGPSGRRSSRWRAWTRPRRERRARAAK